MDFFQEVAEAAADPILGLKQVFNNDPRSEKVDLTIGVYQDETGHIPTLEVVKEASARLDMLSGGYLPIEGYPDYITSVQELLFGEGADVLQQRRVVTVQSLGGTGALKYAADFLQRYHASQTVFISAPTWNNHCGVFERAGFKVETYPYYENNELQFTAFKAKLASMQAKSIVVLHTCCHNPTGMDLSQDDWQEIIEIIKEKQLIPVLDFAYQGFAAGIEEDAKPLRAFVEADVQVLVANSFSKNFSLYRRRIGALSVVCRDAEQAKCVLTQLRTDIRTNNSNPPIDGAAIVATVLKDNKLRKAWETEVRVMRERIASMRQSFLEALTIEGLGERFKSLAFQRGMFSFSGLTLDEVLKLRTEYGIYILNNGRICMAAMNKQNLPIVVKAIKSL